MSGTCRSHAGRRSTRARRIYAATGVQQCRLASSGHALSCHWSCCAHQSHVRLRSAASTGGLPHCLQRPSSSVGQALVSHSARHAGQYFAMVHLYCDTCKRHSDQGRAEESRHFGGNTMRRLAPLVCVLALLTPRPAAPQSGDEQGRPATVSPAPSALTHDAQGRVIIRATRTAQPLTLDGRLDEAAYRDAPPATEFIQQIPDVGAPMTDRSVGVVRRRECLHHLPLLARAS